MAEYIEYHPLKFWLDPASIAEIVAHIQTYLVNNPINSTTEIETIIHDYLIEHPELIGVVSVNGETGEVVLTADNISAGDNVTIKDVLDEVFKFRGNLSGANPITSAVKVGSYSSRKLSTSTGYPEDMRINRYCIIEYLVTSPNKYFMMYEVPSGKVWYYDNNGYHKFVMEDDIYIPDTKINTPDVLKDNYIPHGNSISYNSTAYKIISNTGTITSMDESTESNARWKISEHISATPGQHFVLSTSMRYNNGIIAFYDASDNPISVIMSSDITTPVGNNYTIENYFVTVPNNTSYLIVGYFGNIPANLVLVNHFTIKNQSLYGKKWAFIGDSLSAPTTVRASKKYYDYIAERTGITFTNLGVSGTGYANDYNGAGRFITRVPDIPDDTDVVTIFGSGNDMNVLPIGTADDTTESTVMGYVYLTIQAIFTQKPKVLLGIIAPTPWEAYPPYTADNKMLTFVTELEKMCRKYSIPFLDLYHNSNLRPWDATFRQNYYSKDGGNGVHPDENGNKRFAPMVQDFLERILISD